MKAPDRIKLHRQDAELELQFSEVSYRLSAEFLRVHSPSAEVKGHGPGQEKLQTGKREVQITAVDAVGHYALKLTFNDGHDSGIYTWPYLHDLATRQTELWQTYLEALHRAGQSRDPDTGVVKIIG